MKLSLRVENQTSRARNMRDIAIAVAYFNQHE
jgi:hypothetical protein